MSQPKQSYSQSGEDLIVDFLFDAMLGVKEISYLDIGANDPIDLNNTYHFYEKGYRGVCIDPNPLFREAYRSARPEDTYVVAGVGPKKGKIKFFEISPNTLSTFSEETARQYTEEDGHQLIKTSNVPVLILHDVVKRYFKNKKMPNFLSIDIEGWDYEILDRMDFSKWRPTVICIETLTYASKKKQKKTLSVIELIESKGYFVYADTYINSIFVDKGAWEKR